MEEIHFEVCPYRHNASMDATPPSNAMCPPQAVPSTASSLQAPTRCGRLHCRQCMTWRAAKRYVQKLDIGRVHKFSMERVRKSGISARSEIGNGHDDRRAFRAGGIQTWGRNRAVKTNRLVLTKLTKKQLVSECILLYLAIGQ